VQELQPVQVEVLLSDNLYFVDLLQVEPVPVALVVPDIEPVTVVTVVPDSKPELLQLFLPALVVEGNIQDIADSYKSAHLQEHTAADIVAALEPCPVLLPMGYEYQFLPRCNLVVGVVRNSHPAPDISVASLGFDS
jgi:hypothetical protein